MGLPIIIWGIGALGSYLLSGCGEVEEGEDRPDAGNEPQKPQGNNKCSLRFEDERHRTLPASASHDVDVSLSCGDDAYLEITASRPPDGKITVFSDDPRFGLDCKEYIAGVGTKYCKVTTAFNERTGEFQFPNLRNDAFAIVQGSDAVTASCLYYINFNVGPCE